MIKHLQKVPFYISFWLILAGLTTILAFTVYATVQHSLRSSINIAPAQATKEISSALKQGIAPELIIPATNQSELSENNSIFAAIFDSQGKTITSSVKIDGKEISLPSGVFDYAKSRGENRFTWQPKEGLRQAAVLAYYTASSSGFVLAGQPLTETEKVEKDTLVMTAIGWGGGLLFSFLLSLLLLRGHEKQHLAQHEHAVGHGPHHS